MVLCGNRHIIGVEQDTLPEKNVSVNPNRLTSREITTRILTSLYAAPLPWDPHLSTKKYLYNKNMLIDTANNTKNILPT